MGCVEVMCGIAGASKASMITVVIVSMDNGYIMEQRCVPGRASTNLSAPCCVLSRKGESLRSASRPPIAMTMDACLDSGELECMSCAKDAGRGMGTWDLSGGADLESQSAKQANPRLR